MLKLVRSHKDGEIFFVFCQFFLPTDPPSAEKCYYFIVARNYTIIGIDEAGRGPLAGPIAVGAVLIKNGKQERLLKGIKDSKKLSPQKREEWFALIKENFEWSVAMVGAETIDRIGIVNAAKLGVSRVLRELCRQRKPDMVLLDGSLFAPRTYKQETIIKGDEKIPVISAASIAAKVLRDRKMCRLQKLSPEYCFSAHKGYGTKKHYELLKQNGFSRYHRRSFLKKLH